MALRCLIVDDNARFLDAARDLLEGEDLQVVGVAFTGEEALGQASELRPDLALVDIDLGDESGFDVARAIAEAPAGKDARIILISTHSETDFADLVAESPAVGFLTKSELSLRAIEALLAQGADRGGAEPSAS